MHTCLKLNLWGHLWKVSITGGLQMKMILYISSWDKSPCTGNLPHMWKCCEVVRQDPRYTTAHAKRWAFYCLSLFYSWYLHSIRLTFSRYSIITIPEEVQMTNNMDQMANWPSSSTVWSKGVLVIDNGHGMPHLQKMLALQAQFFFLHTRFLTFLLIFSFPFLFQSLAQVRQCSSQKLSQQIH